jgi:hypothetical protein
VGDHCCWWDPYAATFISEATSWDFWSESQQTPVLGESKLLVRLFDHLREVVNKSQWEVWKIVAGLPIEDAPSIVNYVPDFFDIWDQNSLVSCFGGVYPGLCGQYWHNDVHRAFVDVVKSNKEIDIWRNSLGRCRTYSPMKVPDYVTQWSNTRDYYELYFRSYHDTETGEVAKLSFEISYYADFSYPIQYETNECPMFRIEDDTVYPHVYQYHETTIGWLIHHSHHVYMRYKRINRLISNGNLVEESGWSDTIEIHGECSDAVLFNYTPEMKPYYCTRTYLADQSLQLWTLDIRTPDEDVDIFRVQTSTTETFDVVFTDETTDVHFTGVKDLLEMNDFTINFLPPYYFPPHGGIPLGIYYVRVRGEKQDGSVVSEWSNVFQLDSTTPVWRKNRDYLSNVSYVILVEETHDTSVASTIYVITFLADDTLSYVLTVETGGYYLYTVTSTGYTRIFFSNANLSNNIKFVSFDGHVYLTYGGSYEDFVWIDVTNGNIGTEQVVSAPVDSEWLMWAVLANIHGKLEVVASISYLVPETNESEYFLATQAVLEGETELEVHRDIMSGSQYQIDVWHGSIWFNYEDYWWQSSVGVAWLKPLPSSVFPWVGKFQLQKEV